MWITIAELNGSACPRWSMIKIGFMPKGIYGEKYIV